MKYELEVEKIVRSSEMEKEKCKSNVRKICSRMLLWTEMKYELEVEKIVRSSEMEKEKCKHHLSWNNSQFPNVSQFVNALNSWIYNAAKSLLGGKSAKKDDRIP